MFDRPPIANDGLANAGNIRIETALGECERLAELLAESIAALSIGSPLSIQWILKTSAPSSSAGNPGQISDIAAAPLPIAQRKIGLVYLSYRRDPSDLQVAANFDQRLRKILQARLTF